MGNEYLVLLEITSAEGENNKFYTEIFASNAEEAWIKEKSAVSAVKQNEKVADARVVAVYKKTELKIVDA